MKKYVKTDLIFEFMWENKLTIKKFCSLCKIGTNVYYKIMRGDANFNISALFKIAKVLNIHICKLVY